MLTSSRDVVFVLAFCYCCMRCTSVGWTTTLRMKRCQNGHIMMMDDRYAGLLDQTDKQQQPPQQQLQQQPQQQLQQQLQQQQPQQQEPQPPPSVEENEMQERTRLEFVPIANTASMDISVTNPFGPAVLSLTECQQELLSLLRREIAIENESFYHCRIEYLTKVLEQTYIPAQTVPFLQFILTGEWKQLYSNVLTPRADATLEVDIHQEITPSPTDGMGGMLRNRIAWELRRPDDKSHGDMVVQCGYQINTKGEMDVSLIEHFLLPVGEMPKDPEDLVMSMQRTVPFEVFDPDFVLIKNTFISPELRICRISGDKFYNVFNVFVKDLNGPTTGTTKGGGPLRRGTV